MSDRRSNYAERLPNGNLKIPVRCEVGGGAHAKFWVEIGPDDPRWAEWQDFINEPDREKAARTAVSAPASQ